MPIRPPFFGRRLLKLSLLVSALAGETALSVTAKSLDMDVSMLSYQLNRLSSSDSGAPGTTGTSFYHLGLQYHLPIWGPNLLLSPVIRYMPDSLSAVNSPDGSSKTSMTLIGLPLLSMIGPNKYVGGGFGVMRYTITGTGGTKEMPNGSSTSTFSLPGETITSTTIYGNLAAGMSSGKFNFGGEILIHGLLSSTKRSLSGLVSVGYQTWSWR